VDQRNLEMILQNPIIVKVVQPPVESTTVADVLIGAIGLTGVLVVFALLLGGALGGILIGVKIVRARLNPETASDSDALHIV
jgi:hypothetical protein